ncbi:hypothetical protein [Candidatus Phytoplasma sacchari]|uniref:Integral membrane protein n=1 Tax=Candidatus Phytoplasma sacchari TaxID=2609813 RepID=A0ABY7M2Y5_9MOLU|nr:hypothetical protein [Candidatus Phytoplasma sacchari]KAB8122864.1 hypothetical protein F2B49_00040 [Candidatus Phytoplasma sacchari]WBL31364.1 hypothetical protein O7R10_02010 [Candidatus Phytoplasma sacchari]
MKVFLLKKIVVISLLLAISFIIEFTFNRFILNIDCCHSFIKLELLPIILIGFLFGLKSSFFSNLLYILIHIIIEFSISSQKHGLLTDAKNNYKFLFVLLLFVFVFPYLSCSLSGLYFNFKKKYFFKKKIFFIIFSIITIFQIISYLIFTIIIYNNFNEQINHLVENFLDFFKIKFFNFNSIYFFLTYFFLSILFNNLIIGFILFYFLKYFFKENEYFFY